MLLLSLLASLPAAWVWGDWALLLNPPAEALLLLVLLAALPWRVSWSAALLLALPVGFFLLANGERLAVLGVMGRPGNLLLDVELLPSVLDLLAGNFGRFWALALPLALLLALLAGFLLVAAAIRLVGQLRLPRVAALGSLLVLGACYAVPGSQSFLPSIFAQDSLQHVEDMLQAVRERPRFAAAAREDAFADRSSRELLGSLGGTDVLLIFIESYGRTAIEAPRYAASTGAALDRLQEAAGNRGFSTASGWMVSPTIGGQSWLAHATLASGLRVDSQLRYDLLLRSGRELLPSTFAQAGWRTLLVMPQVTRPWPEAALLGFERTLFQKDLGYRGRPYNWITMPDQYTLAAFERLAGREGAERPLFAEIALVSSHAPWTPIPPVLEDWRAIGDGSIFSTWAEAGESPETLWKDEEKVRRQYGLSIEYVLKTLAGYLERQGERPFLLIALGDHEPAALVSGLSSTLQVPVHVVASDPNHVQAFLDWGFSPGMRPDPRGAVQPMQTFRDWFLEAFSAEQPLLSVK